MLIQLLSFWTLSIALFLTYFPYFEKIKVDLRDYVAVCLCAHTRVCIFLYSTLLLVGNGSVRAPLSLLGNDSVKISLSLLSNSSVIIPLLMLGNGSVETTSTHWVEGWVGHRAVWMLWRKPPAPKSARLYYSLPLKFNKIQNNIFGDNDSVSYFAGVLQPRRYCQYQGEGEV
jgi:hypothetical protein